VTSALAGILLGWLSDRYGRAVAGLFAGYVFAESYRAARIGQRFDAPISRKRLRTRAA
jgi:MFS family permease